MKVKTEDIINNWLIAQQAGAKLPCPRCGRLTMRDELIENPLSRRADIYICPECGNAEGFEDMKMVVRSFGEAESAALLGEKPLEGWSVCRSVYGQPYQGKDRNEGYAFEMLQSVHLSKNCIESILCTAFDGGVTSQWCANVEPLGEAVGVYASEHIARGGEAMLYDLESGEKYLLTADKVAMGVHLWLLSIGSGSAAVCDGEVDPCEIDAEDADAIVQYAVFGEVVFG